MSAVIRSAPTGLRLSGTSTASGCQIVRVAVPSQDDVEALLTQPTGFLELYVGTAQKTTQWELATDAVVRTAEAKEVRGGKRLYGIVEGALLYAFDLAAVGQPLQSHLSARLERVAG